MSRMYDNEIPLHARGREEDEETVGYDEEGEEKPMGAPRSPPYAYGGAYAPESYGVPPQHGGLIPTATPRVPVWRRSWFKWVAIPVVLLVLLVGFVAIDSLMPTSGTKN